MEKRLLVCLNKDDWYTEADRDALVRQIAEQVPAIDPPRHRHRPRRYHAARTRPCRSPRAASRPSSSKVPPSVQALADRMIQIVQRDGRDLLLANLLLQSRGLVDRAKERVRALLDRRADEIITRHMWAAGGTAGINPIPILDIAGGSAITLKMVLELSRVYKQPLDTDSAIKILEQLSKNLIAMVGVTAATPAVVAGIGGLLEDRPRHRHHRRRRPPGGGPGAGDPLDRQRLRRLLQAGDEAAPRRPRRTRPEPVAQAHHHRGPPRPGALRPRQASARRTKRERAERTNPHAGGRGRLRQGARLRAPRDRPLRRLQRRGT